ncbi:MAG: M20/M25/M40 family metallo-hydrolase, partial [Proteobacteria bacterium]|nr:M20/M25/M40 family metallo-hydrolase [Pseudomonadota bacterium]
MTHKLKIGEHTDTGDTYNTVVDSASTGLMLDTQSLIDTGHTGDSGLGYFEADPMVDKIWAKVDQARLLQYVEDISAFDTRYYTTVGNDNAKEWIQTQLESFGYTIDTHTFKFKTTTGENVIATKEGNLSEQIIVAAHYDTIAWVDPEVLAPGANDNGSGVAILLEAARILSRYDTEHTIKFIFFDIEEQGWIGSTHYAEEAYANPIHFVYNIDTVGGQANFQGKQRIVCEE